MRIGSFGEVRRRGRAYGPLPIIGGGAGGGTTWSTTDKGANITLSNGNLTAANNVAGASASFIARANKYVTSADTYFEITIDSLGTELELGWSNSSYPTTSPALGSNTNGISYIPANGAVTYNNIQQSILTSSVPGDKIGLRYNTGTKLFSVYKNGVLLGSSNAFNATSVAGTMGMYSNAGGTANFGQLAFSGGLPSGSVAYDNT